MNDTYGEGTSDCCSVRKRRKDSSSVRKNESEAESTCQKDEEKARKAMEVAIYTCILILPYLKLLACTCTTDTYADTTWLAVELSSRQSRCDLVLL
jgi:hypothetical protein